MKIGSILENQKIEKRIAITPEIVKKYTALGGILDWSGMFFFISYVVSKIKTFMFNNNCG